MAIGSSMMPSGLRALCARTCSVIRAVSETPVRLTSSRGLGLTVANVPKSGGQDLVDGPQVAGGGRRLVPRAPHRLADGGVQRAGLGHLPVDDPGAAGDLL